MSFITVECNSESGRQDIVVAPDSGKHWLYNWKTFDKVHEALGGHYAHRDGSLIGTIPRQGGIFTAGSTRIFDNDLRFTPAVPVPTIMGKYRVICFREDDELLDDEPVIVVDDAQHHLYIIDPAQLAQANWQQTEYHQEIVAIRTIYAIDPTSKARIGVSQKVICHTGLSAPPLMIDLVTLAERAFWHELIDTENSPVATTPVWYQHLGLVLGTDGMLYRSANGLLQRKLCLPKKLSKAMIRKVAPHVQVIDMNNYVHGLVWHRRVALRDGDFRYESVPVTQTSVCLLAGESTPNRLPIIPRQRHDS